MKLRILIDSSTPHGFFRGGEDVELDPFTAEAFIADGRASKESAEEQCLVSSVAKTKVKKTKFNKNAHTYNRTRR